MTKSGTSKLIRAAQAGDLATVQRMVAEECGRNVNEADYDGWTPLIHACHNGHSGVACFLIDLPTVQCNIQTRNAGFTALFFAVVNNHVDIVERLVALTHLHVNRQDQWRYPSWTCLHFACANGLVECVQLLLGHPMIQVEIPDKRGRTALDLAREHNYSVIEAILEEHSRKTVAHCSRNGASVGTASAATMMTTAIATPPRTRVDERRIVQAYRRGGVPELRKLLDATVLNKNNSKSNTPPPPTVASLTIRTPPPQNGNNTINKENYPSKHVSSAYKTSLTNKRSRVSGDSSIVTTSGAELAMLQSITEGLRKDIKSLKMECGDLRVQNDSQTQTLLDRMKLLEHKVNRIMTRK